MDEVEIIQSNNKNKAFKEDANELIKNIKPDILYLDPPYNARQYASNYFILELIAEGWFEKKPKIYGKTGMREYEHQKSKYSSKSNALNALEDLVLSASKSKYILLSYNNEGVISQSRIQKTLERVGVVETMYENHKRYKSINQECFDYDITTMPLVNTLAKTKRQSCRALHYNLFAQSKIQTEQKGFPLQSLRQPYNQKAA
jgi:adenine-specific DNA-methyltransferase